MVPRRSPLPFFLVAVLLTAPPARADSESLSTAESAVIDALKTAYGRGGWRNVQLVDGHGRTTTNPAQAIAFRANHPLISGVVRGEAKAFVGRFTSNGPNRAPKVEVVGRVAQKAGELFIATKGKERWKGVVITPERDLQPRMLEAGKNLRFGATTMAYVEAMGKEKQKVRRALRNVYGSHNFSVGLYDKTGNIPSDPREAMKFQAHLSGVEGYFSGQVGREKVTDLHRIVEASQIGFETIQTYKTRIEPKQDLRREVVKTVAGKVDTLARVVEKEQRRGDKEQRKTRRREALKRLFKPRTRQSRSHSSSKPRGARHQAEAKKAKHRARGRVRARAP